MALHRTLAAPHGAALPARDPAPTVAGRRPRSLAAGGFFALATVVAACAQPGQNQVLPLVVVGLDQNLAPVIQGEEDVVYQVTTEVPFPLRPPEGDDAAALAPDIAPYGREPWIKDADVRVKVRYTLTNLDDQPRTVQLLLDPWNEFARYRPALSVGEDELIIDLSGYDRLIDLPAKGRVVGVITEDDTREMAIDLATAMAILASPPGEGAGVSAGTLINRAMNLQNRSSADDPLLAPYKPAVVAGLTGFDLSLRSFEALNVAVEIQTDVRAREQKYIVEPGKDDPRLPPPGQVVTPPPQAP